VLGGENVTCCIFFLSVLLLFSFPFAILLNGFCHNPRFLPFLTDSSACPPGEGEGVREQQRGSLLPTEANPQQKDK